MESSLPDYVTLRNMSTLRGIPISEAVICLGNLIDGAFDRRSIDDLEHAVTLANDLDAHPIDELLLGHAWAGTLRAVPGVR